MAYLNANIPVMYSQIRREYLYDLKDHYGEVEDCIIFGLASITGRPILFHAIMENGAVFYRLPISAFIQRDYDAKEVPRYRLDELELWNCFSYYPSVTSFDILDGQSGKFFGKDKKTHPGAYLFTVDWAHPESNIIDTDHSEIPHEHKCAHILQSHQQRDLLAHLLLHDTYNFHICILHTHLNEVHYHSDNHNYNFYIFLSFSCFNTNGTRFFKS